MKENQVIVRTHFILYVTDQQRSTNFFRSVLDTEPELNVPGMTEFRLGENVILGLMPEDGIARLLHGAIAHLSNARGVPRSELYLVVDDAQKLHQRSLAAGGREISRLSMRDWGHIVAYSLDLDEHVLAFASVPKDN